MDSQVNESKDDDQNVEIEMVETQEEKSDDIDIPENLQKYKDVIQSIIDKFDTMVASTTDGFQEQDIMIFITEISSIFVKVKKTVEGIKDIEGDDRLTIYNIIVAAIIEKSVMASENLTAEQKDTVRAYFGENGLVTNLIEKIREAYQDMLEKMDTNDDNVVTKDEFEDYFEDKCGCCGNKGCQECCVKFCGSCCFPFLSGGKKNIKVDK